MTERVVLAYSGGLDTSVAIGWIAEQTGAEVIALAIDVGQGGEDLAVIRDRALACGASAAEVVDARAEFAAGYCLPALHSNALYMNRYPLVSALFCWLVSLTSRQAGHFFFEPRGYDHIYKASHELK